MLEPDVLKHGPGRGVVVRHVNPRAEEAERVEYVLQHRQSRGRPKPAVPSRLVANQHRYLCVTQRLVDGELPLPDVLALFRVDGEDVPMRLMMWVMEDLIPFLLRGIDHHVRFIPEMRWVVVRVTSKPSIRDLFVVQPLGDPLDIVSNYRS